MALYPPSLLVPASEIDPGLLKQIQAQALYQVQALARGGDSVSNITVRNLLASDINQTTGGTTALGRLTTPTMTAQTLTQAYSQALQTNQAIAIFGYNILSPNSLIDEIDLLIPGGGTLAKIPLSNLVTEDNPKGYFQPVYFKPQETVQISLLSNAGFTSSGAEQFQLLGFIAEPQGKYAQTRNVTVPGGPGYVQSN